MANYTSKHTGVEIDATVSSGSTTSGVIKDFNTMSGSSTSTIKVGGDITANDLIVNQITASGDISSSGTLTVGTFSPSSISTGNITSSNNISASGNLSITGDLDLDGKSHFNGNITASGDISASGTVTAGTFSISNLSTGNITASAHISGSSTSTITIGGTIEAGGNISSSGDLIVGGNDIFGSAGVKRLTLGATNVFNGRVSASSAISSSGLITYEDFFLKDGGDLGDTLVRIYDDSDDGVIDVYQNNSVKNRIHGNGLSYIQGGDFVIGANVSASNAKLTVRGNVSASGNLFVNGNTIDFNNLPTTGSSVSTGQLFSLSGSQLPFATGSSGTSVRALFNQFSSSKFVLIK